MIAIFGFIILWTITTWVTLKKLIKKGKKKGFISLKNIIHQQVFVQLKIIITSIGFSFLIKKHIKQPT